jgi:pimeloyl-ACP methyl ester carboxylesterase
MWLVVALCTATLPSTASGADEPVRYPIARDEAGAIRLADLVTVVLSELDSGVRIPDDAVETRLPIPRGGASLAVVLGLDAALSRYGVGFELSGSDLTVILDKARLRESTRGLEAWAMGLGGVETKYALVHVGGEPKGAPVVLVHGLDSRAERLQPAAAVLGRQGFQVYVYSYPNDGALDATAKDFARRLRHLRQRVGRPVNVLTTSMGGVITRLALEVEPYHAGTVDRFIACSPPFHGSPMARYHALLEIPETVQDLFTDGYSGLFPFDGLGAAGFDLLPRSTLMRRFASTRRAPDVRYTIFAGSRSILPLELVSAIRQKLFEALPEAKPFAAIGYQLILELTDAVAQVSGGLGDGAVALDSQSLEGVADRLVKTYNHLDCFSGEAPFGPIPWLDEAITRLRTAK